MESLKNAIKTTVQGVGTPVPAALEGKQECPQSSRSSYRSGVEVDPLAPASSKATRRNQEIFSVQAKQKATAGDVNNGENYADTIAEIFKPRSKLLRSPVLKKPESTVDTSLMTPTEKLASAKENNQEVKEVQEEISPREELIAQERAAEERNLKRCREVLNKMIAVLEKQKKTPVWILKKVCHS